MTWYYAQNDERRGPIEADALVALIETRAISPDALVWREGLTDWVPFSSVRAEFSSRGLPNLSAAGTPNREGEAGRCMECGYLFPQTELVEIAAKCVCARCKPLFLQKLREGMPVGGVGGVWRRNRELVVALDAAFPERCVQCNAETTEPRLKRQLYWHHPALYLMIVFPGLLFYAIVAIIVRKRAIFHVAICQEHRAKRRRALLINWGLFAIGVGAIVVGATALRPDQTVWAVFAGILLIITSAIWGSISTRVIYAKKIDKQHAFVGGVCQAFVERFPEWPGR